mgnify:CR=1 FL=1
MSEAAPRAIRHIAIIMDGNGRWAKQRGFPRQVGHERGVEALRRTVEACRDIGIEYLTVFSFSSENWKRPAEEISALFGLLRLYVRQDLKRLKEDGVRVQVIGNREGLPEDILALLLKAETETQQNSRFVLNIAFNYGGRDDIVQACRSLVAKAERGEIASSQIDHQAFESELWLGDTPNPEVLIRTSGEYRISNFMVWQGAYSEWYFTDALWPDFDEEELHRALVYFGSRERRFGLVSEQVG